LQSITIYGTFLPQKSALNIAKKLLMQCQYIQFYPMSASCSNFNTRSIKYSCLPRSSGRAYRGS